MNIWCAKHLQPFTNSNTTVCLSPATEEGKIYQRAFGGMTTEFGEGPAAQRTCAAADRTGHAMLHALYQQSLKYDSDFYIEYFAIDLIMENGECRGVIAMNMKMVLSMRSGHSLLYLQRVVMAGPISLRHQPIPALVMAAAWCCVLVLPLQDLEFVQFHPTGIYGAGRADH